MKEIEVKIMEVSHKDLEAKLISLGAEKIFDDYLMMNFMQFFLIRKILKLEILMKLLGLERKDPKLL